MKLLQLAACLLLAVALSACKNAGAKAISTTGKLAVTTISTAGHVAGAAAKASADAAAKTTVAVVKSSAELGGSFAKTSVVTFKDVGLGVSRDVPWSEGLKLYTASHGADVDLAIKSVRIMRDSKVIRPSRARPNPELKPGDVVELRPVATRQNPQAIR